MNSSRPAPLSFSQKRDRAYAILRRELGVKTFGRVAQAALTIGAAAWWESESDDQVMELRSERETLAVVYLEDNDFEIHPDLVAD